MQSHDEQRQIVCKPRLDENGNWFFCSVPNENIFLPNVSLIPSFLPYDVHSNLESISSDPHQWALIALSHRYGVTNIESIAAGPEGMELQDHLYVQEFKKRKGLKITSDNMREEIMESLYYNRSMVETRQILFNALIQDQECHRAFIIFGGAGSGKSTVINSLPLTSDRHSLVIDNARNLHDFVEAAEDCDKPMSVNLLRCPFRDAGKRVLERLASSPNPWTGRGVYDANYIAQDHLLNRQEFEGAFVDHQNTQHTQFSVIENPRTDAEAFGLLNLEDIRVHIATDQVEHYLSTTPPDNQEMMMEEVSNGVHELYHQKLSQGYHIDPRLVTQMTGRGPSVQSASLQRYSQHSGSSRS